MILTLIILVSLLISLLSLVGIFTIAFNKKFINKVSVLLVSLSAGTLMAGVFLHLLPEASEKLTTEKVFSTTLVSFIIFFLIEKVLGWRHCHKQNCKIHTFGYMSLIGDGVHNFIDGLIIAASFVADVHLGFVTTLAIIMHELPQEIGDFGVLIQAGFSRKKALLLNFLVATTALIGAIAGYFLVSAFESLIAYFLPLAAGGFLYIAASDLLPEIRKETDNKKMVLSFLVFLLGIFIMSLL